MLLRCSPTWSLLFALTSVAACADGDTAKTWTLVASSGGGGRVSALALDAQGNFIGFDTFQGPVRAGADPTAPWTPIPEPATATVRTFLGTSTRHPAVLTPTAVVQSTPEGWVERGPPRLASQYESVLAVDGSGRLIVTTAGGGIARVQDGVVDELYVPPSPLFAANIYVAPDGDVYVVDASTTLEEIDRIADGIRTPMLQARGCPGAAENCVRSARLIGFDASSAMYVAVAAKNKGGYFEPYHRFFRAAKDTWTELPRSGPIDVHLGASCAVTSGGTLYCVRASAVTAERPDASINLVRLDVGASAWVDLGVLPERTLCDVVARDDGRVALSCTDDSLWVSDP